MLIIYFLIFSYIYNFFKIRRWFSVIIVFFAWVIFLFVPNKSQNINLYFFLLLYMIIIFFNNFLLKKKLSVLVFLSVILSKFFYMLWHYWWILRNFLSVIFFMFNLNFLISSKSIKDYLLILFGCKSFFICYPIIYSNILILFVFNFSTRTLKEVLLYHQFFERLLFPITKANSFFLKLKLPLILLFSNKKK